MRIWIDLANAPHVAFFTPIVRELQRLGHQPVISLRDFNQTVDLARLAGLGGTVIGRHGGASTVGKALNLVGRAFRLASFARRERIDVAVSHNSYTQIVAGRIIGARVITLMDYEGQPANHIAFRLAHRVVVPRAFPEKDLRRFGCGEPKVVRYDGFKEQVYLSSFCPDPGFPAKLARACRLDDGWRPERSIIVTVRAPATGAAYHPFANGLYEKLLDRLQARPDLLVIVLPRTRADADRCRALYPRLRIPDAPLSGNDLVHLSDLVISAGGTMNREAAVLGTPVCTIFAGELPAVDRSLVGMGRLSRLTSEDDIDALRFVKKNGAGTLKNSRLCAELTRCLVSG